MQHIRLLLIENSTFLLDNYAQELLKRLPSGSLVEKSDNPVDALSKIRIFQPNIIVMNFALGLMTVDGKQFLPFIAEQPPKTPVIVYGLMGTSYKTAIAMGAHDYLKKPSAHQSIAAFFDAIIQTATTAACPLMDETPVSNVGPGAMVTREIWHASMPEKGWFPVAAAAQKPSAHKADNQERTEPPVSELSPAAKSSAAEKGVSPSSLQQAKSVTSSDICLVAIGSSTGGTEALSYILTHLSPPMPAIVIVQHIPPMFSRLLAQRLDSECRLSVKEAASGDIIRPDHVYIAPGSQHMTVYRHGSQLMIDCRPGAPVHSCCPSVDILFQSVAREVGSCAMGVILTGMGHDGAAGLLEMHRQGAPTLGQDKDSCVVYGMPKAAYELGAVDRQVPLNDMPAAITKLTRR